MSFSEFSCFPRSMSWCAWLHGFSTWVPWMLLERSNQESWGSRLRARTVMPRPGRMGGNLEDQREPTTLRLPRYFPVSLLKLLFQGLVVSSQFPMQQIFYSGFLECLNDSSVWLCYFLCLSKATQGTGKRPSRLTGSQLLRGNCIQRSSVRLRFLLTVTTLSLGTFGIATSECCLPVPKRRSGSRHKGPSFSFSINTLVSESIRSSAQRHDCSTKGRVSPHGFF